jgi:hypothetical protein
MLYETEEPPISNIDGFKLKGGLNSFIFWIWVWECRTIKGDIINLLKCVTKCSNPIHIHPQLLSQDSQIFIVSTLAVLPGATLPHLKSGTAVVRHYRSWAAALPWLNWLLGVGGYLYLSHPSPTALLPPLTVQTDTSYLVHVLSSPLVTLSSQAFLCDFLINPWEKRLQNSIRE